MRVDLLVLSRDLGALREDVAAGIAAQVDVELRVVRITGPRQAGDRDVLDAIVRGRNAGKRQARAELVMLLDDDVVLGPGCVRRLAEELARRPEMAAVGADSADEMRDGRQHWDYPGHVGMAAVMFRRERLEGITFRWEPGRCECQCCCDDLRRSGYGIGYCRGALAWHRPAAGAVRHVGRGGVGGSEPGRVLVAFDRMHLRLFLSRFLGSLRACGNGERVTAVVSGLRLSEQRMLGRREGVEVVAVPRYGHPARERLRNFRMVLEGWAAGTPVAYWDAGDVVFQGRIAGLWDLVRGNPGKLLAATEVIPFRESVTFRSWVETIADRAARARAVHLFEHEQTINSGFAAGTAGVLAAYCRAAYALLHSPELAGTGDWGDQTAMNLYCRAHPAAWREIGREWNYCLVGLGPGQIRVSAEGWIERVDGGAIRVVHGAGRTLGAWDEAHLAMDWSRWGRGSRVGV